MEGAGVSDENAERHPHGHHEHAVHEAHAHAHVSDNPIEALLSNRLILIAAFIVIIAVVIWLRLGLAQYQGLFEPDAFFYYSIIRATLISHLHEPQYLGLSGFSPNHSFIGEAPGLPYLTVIFYLLVGWSGVSALTVMRYLPVLFAIAEAVLAYLIAKELTKSRALGLLAMIMVAVSSGNIARTAALVYRGDSFISVPLMAALYLLLRALREDEIKRQVIYGFAATFALSTGFLIWNGSSYIIAVYLLGLALLAVYGFVQNQKTLAKRVLVVTAILFLLLPLQLTYLALKGARPGLILEGPSFVAFYIPVLLAAALSFYGLKKMMHGFMLSKINRTILVVVFIALVAGVVGIAFKGYVSTLSNISGTSSIVSTNTTQARGEAIGTTTQELQKPSLVFIFASFNLQMMLAPIGVVMFLLIGDDIADSSDAGTGERRLLSVNPAFVMVLAYLLITLELQSTAIRWNSLLSIPMAIFAAYAAYGLVMSAWRINKISNRQFAVVALVIIIMAGYTIYSLGSFIWALFGVPSLGYAAEGIGCVGALALIILYSIIWFFLKDPKYKMVLVCMAILIVALAVLAGVSAAAIQSYSSGQADGINPGFLSAMTWMKANTPVNATVLTLWPDGSVVEGWANRTSYMDSVGGENETRIYYFANFLINGSSDPQYLYGIGKPDYLVARQYWMIELEGLIAEGVPANPNLYSYVALQPSNIGHNANNTIMYYDFQSQDYQAILVVNHTTNTTNSSRIYSAYLQVNSTYSTRLSKIIFYNLSNNAYNIINTTVPSSNYTLMVFFSGSQISTALLMTNGLEQSNLFKFVYLCNNAECEYNASGVQLNLVYVNNDTKIYHIAYT